MLLFKLEGQIIQRHPEFDMTNRLLLDKIDHDTGTVTLADGSVWPLTTNDFPTVDPADPYTLTPQEQHIIDKLVSEFVTADHLHRHIDFLYSHGSMYKVANGNLLFHGCVPLNEDGTFSSMNCL
ncbi:fructose-1,6-bisphosphatase, partial [human gut metagenome]